MLLQPIDVANDGLRAELRVRAPAAVVSEYIGDLQHMEAWWPEHPVYRRLRGNGGPGTLYAWIYMARGFPVAGMSRVLVRDPARRFEYRAGPPGLGVRFAYRFAQEGDATRVEFSCRTPFARLRGFATHMVPEVTKALERLEGQITDARA